MQNNNSKLKINLKHRAYFYTLAIIKFIDTLDKKDFSVQVIVKQLLRSATIIGANIIEAQAGSTKKDFTNFFNYSLKSANESKFWLGLLRVLASSILTLKGKKKF